MNGNSSPVGDMETDDATLTSRRSAGLEGNRWQAPQGGPPPPKASPSLPLPALLFRRHVPDESELASKTYPQARHSVTTVASPLALSLALATDVFDDLRSLTSCS